MNLAGGVNVGPMLIKEYRIESRRHVLAQRLMESGYKLRRTDRGWHQWEMACITGPGG
jgi:hypothetical protein